MAYDPKRVPGRRRIGRVLAGVGIALGLFAFSVGTSLLADWLWYSAVGFQNVFLTIQTARTGLFLVGAVAFFSLFALNLTIARRLVHRREGLWHFIASLEARRADQIFGNGVLIAGGLIGLAFGAYLAARWRDILRGIHGGSFGLTDPLLGQDVGFFVFQLPLLRLIQSTIFVALVFLLLTALAVYAYKLILPQLPSGPVRADAGFPEIHLDLEFDRAIRVHLACLLAAGLLTLGAGFAIDGAELVYSDRGVAQGAGYADVTVTQNVLKGLVILSAVAAAFSIAGAFRQSYRLTGITLGLLVVAWFVGAGILPALIQRFEVQPNEFVKERPYIESNIRMTRIAYGLHQIVERPFPIREAVTAREVAENPTTIRNIRLWDPKPLRDTYNQIQSIRQYYEFRDIDIDRYVLNGEYRQVMLSARELAPERLQTTAQTWVNRVLQYTHGYGVVVSPVNEVTPEGLPILLVRDLPPQGVLPIDRPEIYYGEKTEGYVIVDTRETEFDYPRGDENVFTRYQGSGGVQLSTFFHRLLFAKEFADVNILLSNALTPESQILFNRNIRARIQKVAPFLMLDPDPYLVIEGGRLYWIQDAYTYTSRFPYAQTFGQPPIDFNYLRNSVKIVTDTYSGQMTFYQMDDDPLLAAYTRIFPDLFRPAEELPDALRAHLRYPEFLFLVQSEIYRTYHMEDPRVFYNKEDLWAIPNEIYLEPPAQPMQPYYVIMRLPGEATEEFVLMRPYSPSGRDNMITWLAGRSDGAHYGQLIAYKYPKETTVYGPMQIESRIDQDPRISPQLTLWNQQGSRVLRGNLLVIPIGLSNLYVESIFLQSEQSKLPELKRVIVSTGGTLVMETTVGQAIEALLRGSGGALPAETPTAGRPADPGGALSSDQARQLAQSLRDRAGNLRRELDNLERDLTRLAEAIGAGGGPAATPTPTGR